MEDKLVRLDANGSLRCQSSMCSGLCMHVLAVREQYPLTNSGDGDNWPEEQGEEADDGVPMHLGVDTDDGAQQAQAPQGQRFPFPLSPELSRRMHLLEYGDLPFMTDGHHHFLVLHPGPKCTCCGADLDPPCRTIGVCTVFMPSPIYVRRNVLVAASKCSSCNHEYHPADDGFYQCSPTMLISSRYVGIVWWHSA